VNADAGQVEAALGYRCHSGEDGVLPLSVDEVRRRRSIFRRTKVRGIFPHHHQLFGNFKWQRPQQHGIHCAEDYSICANAERDRKQ
jgi:hypothetical protein